MEKKYFIKPLEFLGYTFRDEKMTPSEQLKLRNEAFSYPYELRNLSVDEIMILERNNNFCPKWSDVYVGPDFDVSLVRHCTFYGLIRIGNLQKLFLSFSDLSLPVGLYNSKVINCDFGDNVVIDQVAYIANYVIGNEVILFNINELVTSETARFGNGILRDEEEEDKRIWLELCNENQGRKILPYDGMLPGDAYLWTRNRHDVALQEAFIKLTDHAFDKKNGIFGRIGNHTVIKNTRSIKDALIGSNAYIKGANKIKNVTIHSGMEGHTQIGEGCEIVNGIVGFGCRIFYGVKAVRFILGDHAQLKYGARLINSYLGFNSTISCCEVLNALIFPNHEQHHNNSFLCSALLMGQSNLAAGATIGSNHNSRAADGELEIGRGFWPGLCVSIKHPSKFSSYCILVKGDYPAELNIQLPFSLVSNDLQNNELRILPAYWFIYNQYALERNAWKYGKRNKRTATIQAIDYDYLAPDTVAELFNGKLMLWEIMMNSPISKRLIPLEKIMDGKFRYDEIRAIIGSEPAFYLPQAENGKRSVRILKINEAYQAYTNAIIFYGARALFHILQKAQKEDRLLEICAALPTYDFEKYKWLNIGGQLIREVSIKKLYDKLKKNEIKGWDEVHQFYIEEGEKYAGLKEQDALLALCEVSKTSFKNWDIAFLVDILCQFKDVIEIFQIQFVRSRKKDFDNPFRLMMYENEQEMQAVLGNIENDPFIKNKMMEWDHLKHQVARLVSELENLSGVI
jgi:NDP-sugar pyrophosphorylase family protein